MAQSDGGSANSSNRQPGTGVARIVGSVRRRLLPAAAGGGAVAAAGSLPNGDYDLAALHRRNSRIKKLSFWLFVALPTFLAAVYYFAIASEQYEAEARFVVRAVSVSAVQQSEEGEGGGGGPAALPSSLTQDAYIVASFIKSIDFVRQIEDDIDLRAIFSDPSVDRLSRLDQNASDEELRDFWQGMVTTHVDPPSGIIILKVRAFTPENAQAIAELALERSRLLVNDLSERAKQDLVRRAELEVEQNLEQYTNTLLELRDYQNRVGILDPLAQARGVSELIVKLSAAQLEDEVRLAVLEDSDVSGGTVINQLRAKLRATEEQIERLRGQLAGPQSESGQLSASLTTFAELETSRLLNESLYEAAQRNLDAAKSAALRKSVFLGVFSEPTVPDDAVLPKAFNSVVLIALFLFALWSTAILSWASVEDHMD